MIQLQLVGFIEFSIVSFPLFVISKWRGYPINPNFSIYYSEHDIHYSLNHKSLTPHSVCLSHLISQQVIT